MRAPGTMFGAGARVIHYSRGRVGYPAYSMPG